MQLIFISYIEGPNIWLIFSVRMNIKTYRTQLFLKTFSTILGGDVKGADELKHIKRRVWQDRLRDPCQRVQLRCCREGNELWTVLLHRVGLNSLQNLKTSLKLSIVLPAFLQQLQNRTHGQAHFCGQQMQHMGWLVIAVAQGQVWTRQNESLCQIKNYLNFTILEEMYKSLN